MIDIVADRLRRYRAGDALEEGNALKEILQEIALYALWRADFFDVALFQGGTSLRILHKLPRFSEDLDFLLRVPDPGFDWSPYLAVLRDVTAQFGLKLDAQPKSRMDTAIRQAVLKEDSIASQLDLAFADGGGRSKAIRIKLEIDVDPPAGSREASTFLDFPLDHEVRHQDLASNLALKIHALLCRGFLKGRDWFDFAWYVSRGVAPNLDLLGNALAQAGPWRGEAVEVDIAWLEAALAAAIARIDWKEATADVARFLRPAQRTSTGLWSERFFRAKLEGLVALSGGQPG